MKQLLNITAFLSSLAIVLGLIIMIWYDADWLRKCLLTLAIIWSGSILIQEMFTFGDINENKQ